jgi:pantothenate synthetase
MIHQILQWAKTALQADQQVDAIQEEAMQKLRDAGFRPEYFEIVDGVTLKPIRPHGSLLFREETGFTGPIVACTAVFAGEVRLIDNLMLFP